MVHKRVQVRHDDSDNGEDWSDAEYGNDDLSESSGPDEMSAGGSRHTKVMREADEDEDDSLADSRSEDEDVTASNSEDEDPSDDGEDVAANLASVSFGALAKAQRSLKRKRDEEEGGSDSDDNLGKNSGASIINDSRNATRLANVKDQFKAFSAESKSSLAESLKKAREKRESERGSSRINHRSSKHAPTEMSSKKAVSRRRIVVDLPADTTRDPRFDRVGGPGAPDARKIERNYAFLDDYRDSEIKELRQQVAKEKNPSRKEELQKTLQSLESKRETRKRRLDREGILAEHKKKERDAIKDGKKPFYLKKSEQKKLVLTTQFSKMGQKQRSKVIEKKRKKIAAKEKKQLPWSRRTAGGAED